MLMEGLRTLSPKRLQKLLVECHSVKLKRLEIRVLLAKAAHFVETDFHFLPVLVSHIPKRARVENLGLEALYMALLNGPEYRIRIKNARRRGAEIDNFRGGKFRS
jgi:hypothetical protein